MILKDYFVYEYSLTRAGAIVLLEELSNGDVHMGLPHNIELSDGNNDASDDEAPYTACNGGYSNAKSINSLSVSDVVVVVTGFVGSVKILECDLGGSVVAGMAAISGCKVVIAAAVVSVDIVVPIACSVVVDTAIDTTIGHVAAVLRRCIVI
ncbi:Hypothetical predicted protein [Octopus vulgaris]|uniref:Uncharacterized protein n=1 Tax=Octopus vulgaris TaxID=6645 RepID=A0AA36AXY6_OCTVU|nr:Hypothetical predicted protein [Octopus vulgaris]